MEKEAGEEEGAGPLRSADVHLRVWEGAMTVWGRHGTGVGMEAGGFGGGVSTT